MASREHDEHWDELALGHVLGGLPDVDASEFRGHLAGCAQCRARVAELRSMASDLAAAEREERATQRLRTQIEARRDPEPPATEPTRTVSRRAVVLTVVAAVVVSLLSLWNAHLRMQTGELREVMDLQERTLATLGGGTVVPAQTSSDVTGVVSVDGDRVAYSLAGVPTPSASQRVVVWLEVDGQLQQVAVHTPNQMQAGQLASTQVAVDASRLLVTLESLAVPARPEGQTLLEADLNGRPPEPAAS